MHGIPKGKSIKFISNSLFCAHWNRVSGWFRLFGRGLYCKDRTECPLSFSERNGYTKVLNVGNWLIGYLPKKIKL